MKFGLIINDLTKEEVAEVLGKLSPLNITAIAEVPAVPIAPVDERAAAITTGLEGSFIQTPAEPVPPVLPTLSPKVAPKIIPGAGVDSENLPWDDRIHAGSKLLNKNGTWKKKRGLDDATFEAVRAELRASSMPTAVEAPAALPVTAVPVEAPAALPVTAVPVEAPVMPLMPAALPVTAVEEAPARDFQGLMQQVSSLFSEKKIEPDYPDTIVKRINDGYGVTLNSITDVANDERMVEYAWQCLEVDGKGL